jgi:hypothetical protein
MKIELNATRHTSGELRGSWEVTAWQGSTYLGSETFIFYSKREALSRARQTVANEGGLGIYRKSA